MRLICGITVAERKGKQGKGDKVRFLLLKYIFSYHIYICMYGNIVVHSSH